MADDPKHKYVNFAKVVFTPNEFFCDFITLYPLVEDKPAPPGELLQVRGDVVGRFAMSPAHAKQLLQILAQTVSRYEEQYGEIVVHGPPPTNVTLN